MRKVPIPPELMVALKACRSIGPLFPWLFDADMKPPEVYRITWEGFQTAMYDLDNSIEADDGKSVLTAHYYRHNYASLLYKAGVDVLTAQKWLGHGNPATTMAIYTHLSEQQEMENASKVADIFSKVARRRFRKIKKP